VDSVTNPNIVTDYDRSIDISAGKNTRSSDPIDPMVAADNSHARRQHDEVANLDARSKPTLCSDETVCTQGNLSRAHVHSRADIGSDPALDAPVFCMQKDPHSEQLA
jgi:hypothetical protein